MGNDIWDEFLHYRNKNVPRSGNVEHTLVPRSQWLRVAPWIKFTVTQITPVICHICLACFMHKCPRNDPGNSSTFVASLAWLLLGDLDLDLSSVQWAPTTTWYVGGQQKQHLSVPFARPFPLNHVLRSPPTSPPSAWRRCAGRRLAVGAGRSVSARATPLGHAIRRPGDPAGRFLDGYCAC